jgi:hypothetical protein
MARTIKTEDFEVFTLDELDENAREKAIEAISDKLAGDWWDSHDINDINDVIRYTLADEFGTPGRDQYGVADFPGVPGVELDGWDLDRGPYLELRGTLTPENAPSLPWEDGIVEVTLTPGREYTSISVDIDEDEVDLMNLPDLGHNRADRVRHIEGEMEQAIHNAMSAALKSGRDELEYKTGDENTVAVIEANEYEFEADGTPYFG